MSLTELSDLRPGLEAEIAGVLPGREQSERLAELGFTPGAKVRCLFKAPSGSPGAYLIRNAVIALRDTDASAVLLKI